MDFDPNEITRYVESFHLNYWEGFTESDVDDFVSSIDTKRVPEFDYDAGATKLVIMPENRDYVIKIPFSGLYNEWGDYIPFNGAEDDGYGSIHYHCIRRDYPRAAVDVTVDKGTGSRETQTDRILQDRLPRQMGRLFDLSCRRIALTY